MEDVLDPAMVARAQDFVKQRFVHGGKDRLDHGRQNGHSNDAVVRDLLCKSPAWKHINQMLGGRATFGGAHVVVQYPGQSGNPDTWKPRDWHIDGMHTSNNGVARGALHPFCLLVGIALSGSDEPFTGNLGYFPKSHIKVAEASLNHPSGPRAMVEHGAENTSVEARLAKLGLPRQALGEARQAIVKPTDVYLAHYNTVHFGGPNWKKGVPRVALYYRVHVNGYNHTANYQTDIPNPWKHFIGFQ